VIVAVPALDFDLQISADEYLKRYRAAGAVVIVRALDGRRLQFPAGALQRFVSHSGVSGRFRITFDNGGKLVGLERLG
jgi:hypothetical protein